MKRRSGSVYTVPYRYSIRAICRGVISGAISMLGKQLMRTFQIDCDGIVLSKESEPELEMVNLVPLTLASYETELAGNKLQLSNMVLTGTQIRVPWKAIYNGGASLTVARITGNVQLPNYQPDSQRQQLLLSLREVESDPTTIWAISTTLQKITSILNAYFKETSLGAEEMLLYVRQGIQTSTTIWRDMRYQDETLTIGSIQLSVEQRNVTLEDVHIKIPANGAIVVTLGHIHLDPSSLPYLPRIKTKRYTSRSGPIRDFDLRIDHITIQPTRENLAQAEAWDLHLRSANGVIGLSWASIYLRGMMELRYDEDVHVMGSYHTRDSTFQCVGELYLQLSDSAGTLAWLKKMSEYLQLARNRFLVSSGEGEKKVTISGLRCQTITPNGSFHVRIDDILLRGNGWRMMGIDFTLDPGIEQRIVKGSLQSCSRPRESLHLRHLHLQTPGAQLTMDHFQSNSHGNRIRGVRGLRLGRVVKGLLLWSFLLPNDPPVNTREAEIGYQPSKLTGITLHKPLGSSTLIIQIETCRVHQDGRVSMVTHISLDERHVGSWYVTLRQKRK